MKILRVSPGYAFVCFVAVGCDPPLSPQAPGAFDALAVPDNNFRPGAIIVAGVSDVEDLVLCPSGATSPMLGQDTPFSFSQSQLETAEAKASAAAKSVVEAEAKYENKIDVNTSYEEAVASSMTGFPVWANFTAPCRQSVRAYLTQNPEHELGVVSKSISAKLLFKFEKRVGSNVNAEAALDELTPALESAHAGVSLEKVGSGKLLSSERVIVAYDWRFWTPPAPDTETECCSE